MRVVFDTNALISSTLWDGSVAQRLLFKLFQTNAKVFSSVEILSEYQKVLKRDFDYSDEEIVHILQRILSIVILIKPTEKIDVVKEDPDDNKIIECALASSSEYIVTYDKHLLNLKEFKKIKIVKPWGLIGLI